MRIIPRIVHRRAASSYVGRIRRHEHETFHGHNLEYPWSYTIPDDVTWPQVDVVLEDVPSDVQDNDIRVDHLNGVTIISSRYCLVGVKVTVQAKSTGE